jgi:diguanylate cyclase (GGDEF)-like protein
MNMGAIGRLARAIRGRLPRGGELPDAEFERRHRSLVMLLWLCAAALPLYALLAGYGIAHTLTDGLVPIFFGTLAAPSAVSRRLRSIAATLGLSSCAALGVSISGGLIEAHFAFFVLVVLLTLYEDWAVFGLAVAFVLVHHGVLGTVDPRAVYHSANQYQHPWTWAGIHAVFVAAAGAAAVLAWRLNEDVRAQMRDVQAELEHAAHTDALTGLANRRALLDDLDRAADRAQQGSEPAVLVLGDLDGFKSYNDTFGHQAGDALLQRLGRTLAEATAPWGTAYRLGGDEFCVLARGGDEVRAAAEAATFAGLCEQGEGFTIGNSRGSALLPTDAASASEALRVADQRMYTQKTFRRPTAEFQTKNVLRCALAESHPQLGHSLDNVAELAELVARAIGLGREEIERVRLAAELHDIGKVAIPGQILLKQGELDEDEWEFIRRHTVIGERIIAAAPALAHVARIVRSTHERWDGTGYPDGIAADDIPIAARIVSVCDAFDAMVSDRPYRAARSVEEALAELHSGSGTQFDPAVVRAFERVITDPLTADERAVA